MIIDRLKKDWSCCSYCKKYSCTACDSHDYTHSFCTAQTNEGQLGTIVQAVVVKSPSSTNASNAPILQTPSPTKKKVANIKHQQMTPATNSITMINNSNADGKHLCVFRESTSDTISALSGDIVAKKEVATTAFNSIFLPALDRSTLKLTECVPIVNRLFQEHMLHVEQVDKQRDEIKSQRTKLKDHCVWTWLHGNLPVITYIMLLHGYLRLTGDVLSMEPITSKVYTQTKGERIVFHYEQLTEVITQKMGPGSV